MCGTMASTARRLTVFEAALSVGEASGEHGLHHHVVDARNNFALEGSRGARVPHQPRADGNVTTFEGNGVQQSLQMVELGGQVHVHVANDVRPALQPGVAERPAASALL